MAWGWSKTRYSPIAVDFGADSLKLLQIIPSDPPQLLTAASVKLPESLRTDQAARPAFFSASLKNLIKNHGFKGRRIICSIPAYQTLVQHLQVARTDDPQGIETQVHQQLLERLNVDPSRMVVRCFHVGQVLREGGTKQEVICMAASRDSTLQYLDIARQAKLEMVGMHSEPMAILRAFAHLYRREADTQRTTCFIDIGAATTKVMITHGIELAFAKVIHSAGDQLTHQFAQDRGIDFTQARLERFEQTATDEQLQAHVAEQSDTTGSTTLSHPPPANAGMDAITHEAATDTATAVKTAEGGEAIDILDCLLDELKLCVRYHHSTFPDRAIEKLIFLGGESRHADICQKIARTLRIGAQRGDPLARLVRINQSTPAEGVDIRQPQPGWAVPMGLCLSEANL